jgi:hypothetical protein
LVLSALLAVLAIVPSALLSMADQRVTWSIREAGRGTVDARGKDMATDAPASDRVVASRFSGPGAPGVATVTVAKPGRTATSDRGSPSFALMSEFYGDAGATARQLAKQGLLNGVTFHPPLTSSERQALTNGGRSFAFAYFAIPAEAGVSSCYPSSIDANAGALVTSYSRKLGPKVWRLGMVEFDQGGGCWASGRPGLGGMTDAQAYGAWMDFYLNLKGLGRYLNQTVQQRGHKWMSLSSYAFSVQYALDMGVDAVLLERNEDEMSGITPGLAMIRGAATQHGGKEWGIDLSTWRYWNDGPTVYANGKLVTGWSTSTFKRNLYISYMGGANIAHIEAADFTTGAAAGSGLNPLGETVRGFYDFAVIRHPNRGTPYVPMALMQDHQSGFEPKYGEWMQAPWKWYWSNPYSSGDRMFANLLDLIYPDHHRWGTLGPGAPKVRKPDGSIDVASTQAAYRRALAGGADPRPWEPMGNSRWGETFDVITTRASPAAMQRYKVILLATGTATSEALLASLTQYVQQGGTLVLNARQLTASAESISGLHLTSARASAVSETWVPDGSVLSESRYDYTIATPTSAAVIAHTDGNPIVTKNEVGAGTVYVTTPDFLADARGTQILNVGQRLIGALQRQLALVEVAGPQVEYLISTDGPRIVVTLVNTDVSGAAWSGLLSFAQPPSPFTIREWTSDVSIPSSVQDGKVTVGATVPPFDVRVYVLDSLSQARKP